MPGDALNTTKASDGTTLANTIQVTFDEPIDPSTFGISNVGVYYKSPAGGTSISLPIVSVTPLDPNQFGAVNFLITFNPASLAGTTYGFVGTYSYVIYPVGNPNASPTGISDRIRHVISGGTIATGNVMDQNANGTPAQPHDDDYVIGQPTTVPVTYTATTALPTTITKGTSEVVLGKTVITPSMLMSPLSVIDDYLLQPDNGVLPGVTLTLNITYPRDPDLAAFLLAPDGTEVPLFIQNASLRRQLHQHHVYRPRLHRDQCRHRPVHWLLQAPDHVQHLRRQRRHLARDLEPGHRELRDHGAINRDAQ